jgi:hypothetical protein
MQEATNKSNLTNSNATTLCRLVGKREKKRVSDKNKKIDNFKMECARFDEVALISNSAKRKHISMTTFTDLCNHRAELLEDMNFPPIKTPGCLGNWQTPNLSQYFKQITQNSTSIAATEKTVAICTGGCTWCCGQCERCIVRLQSYFRKKNNSSSGNEVISMPRGFAASLEMRENEIAFNDNYTDFNSDPQSLAEKQYISDILDAADSHIQSIYNRFVLEDTYEVSNEIKLWRFRLPKVGVEVISPNELETIFVNDITTVWPDTSYGSLVYSNNDFASILAVQTKHKDSTTPHVHYACNCRSKHGREGKF